LNSSTAAEVEANLLVEDRAAIIRRNDFSRDIRRDRRLLAGLAEIARQTLERKVR